jgi:uncharacterized caspase-like protein
MVLMTSLAGAASAAEVRLALVIGNSSYRSVTKLPNPDNDARAVADDLKSASFDVTLALDVSQVDMRRAIKTFAAKIAKGGPDAVVLVYYAGHGVQVDGENFLVPIDARIERESDIAGASIRLAELMSALAAVPSRIRIVILDACRNNPFATTKSARGFAMVDAPNGSIVAYSTAPGTEATDGSNGHSPYTEAFIEVSKEPRIQIEQLFKLVRLKVNQATSGQQTPWESSSLTANFWFRPTSEPAPNVEVATAAPPSTLTARVTRPVSAPNTAQAPAPQAPTPPPAPPQRVATATVPQDALPPAPRAPPSDQPGYAPAPNYAGGPQPNYTPNYAPSYGPPPGYLPAPSYGQAPNYPPPPYGPPPTDYAAGPPPAMPVVNMQGLSADEAYDLMIEDDTVPAYEEFLLLYSSDPRAEWVRTALALRVDAMAWHYASVVNTPTAYADYATRYPGGAYVGEASRLRARPRLRPIDAVIAPRVMAPPPSLRVALPMLQIRRPPGAHIMLPVMHTRPGRFEHATRFTPGSRLPGSVRPAFAPRFAPNQLRHERAVNPNFRAPNGFPRQNAVNVPGAGPHFRQVGLGQGQPVLHQGQGQPSFRQGHGQPSFRQGNPQFRSQQRVQVGGQRQKGPPPCRGRDCRH